MVPMLGQWATGSSSLRPGRTPRAAHAQALLLLGSFKPVPTPFPLHKGKTKTETPKTGMD